MEMDQDIPEFEIPLSFDMLEARTDKNMCVHDVLNVEILDWEIRVQNLEKMAKTLLK